MNQKRFKADLITNFSLFNMMWKLGNYDEFFKKELHRAESYSSWKEETTNLVCKFLLKIEKHKTP